MWLCAWSGFDCAIDQKNSHESATKIRRYRCHAWNIYFDMDNLSQTGMILPKRHFIPHNFHRDTWWNLWLSGSYGYFDSQQNGAAIDVSANVVSYSCFYWNKYDCTWGIKVRSGCQSNMPHMRQRLMRCHWSWDQPRVGNYATAWMDSWRVTQQILHDFRNKFLTSSPRNSITACFDTRRSLHI